MKQWMATGAVSILVLGEWYQAVSPQHRSTAATPQYLTEQ